MRFSDHLQKNIIETHAGRLLSKFKIKSRRDVLFFEDILVDYIKECEKNGYEKEIRNVSKKWMNLTMQQMTPKILKKAPLFFLNKIMKNLWVSLGLMSDLSIIKSENIIEIKTKNETPTRVIGENNFIVGFYEGILNILFKSNLKCIKFLQTKRHCKYTFNIEDEPFDFIKCKEKEVYNKLNQLPESVGIDFKSALKKGIFNLKKDNKIYFRGKSIILGENTLSHLISNSNLLPEKIPYISYDFFKKIIKEDSTDEEKLVLIKTILQIMGWGIIKVKKSKKYILMEIKNPPYGLQSEKDNWEFLIRTVLGYLWLLDKDFVVKNIKEQYKKLIILYSK